MAARPKIGKKLAAKVIAGVALGAALSTALPGIETIDRAPTIYFRSYQRAVFLDKSTKILLLEWSRQIGKSYTLANWAVDRLASQLAKPGITKWLIVVISNSKGNGGEFAMKVGEAAQAFRDASVEVGLEHGISQDEVDEFGISVDDCQFKLSLKLTIEGVVKTGRIIVLSASPRTARGFSGDLILDEFAHHENAKAMWTAAEPIISSNEEFLCRISSTHNGVGSLFNRWIRTGQYPVHSMSRSQAWAMSRNDPVAPLKIISLKTGREITPGQARDEADDQRAYDQNYENDPSSESGALISWSIITESQKAPPFVMDQQRWSAETLTRLSKIDGELYGGMDVGRTQDISVIYVGQKMPDGKRVVRAGLTMKGVDHIPHQSSEILRLFEFLPVQMRRMMIDATGEGAGLVQYARLKLGNRIVGVHMGQYVPITLGLQASGRRDAKIPITEAMATELLARLRDHILLIPPCPELANSLHMPEKVVSHDGLRVMIASSHARDEDGYLEHADRFWALALMEWAISQCRAGSFTVEDVMNVMAGANLFQPPLLSFPAPGGGDGMMRFG